ncbi:MAG: hypothetical protein IJZ74_03370 [Clostridia bacterium]|nr:hypothetical protein [Clostridia bacterium]
MQQLFLTGIHAANIASRLFTALNVRPTGYRITPFMVDGAVRGDALHLLVPPSPPLYNDVPFRIRIAAGDTAIVPRALDEAAAPSLLAALNVHTPMLLGGLSADMLACERFRTAVRQCLMSQRPVVVVADEDASDALRALTPPERQEWIAVPHEPDARSAMLEHLITEAAMRF